MNHTFPCDNRLKINELSRIFDKKTESYKLFWFGSLLSNILNGKVACRKVVAFCITKYLNENAEIEDYFVKKGE